MSLAHIGTDSAENWMAFNSSVHPASTQSLAKLGRYVPLQTCQSYKVLLLNFSIKQNTTGLFLHRPQVQSNKVRHDRLCDHQLPKLPLQMAPLKSVSMLI